MKDYQKFSAIIGSIGQQIVALVKQNGLSINTLTAAYNHFTTQLVPIDETDFACSAGCGYCCHIRITASVAEVLCVYSYLQTEGRLAEVALKTKHLSEGPEQRAEADNSWWVSNRISCLFLDPKTFSCTVYAVRPFSCRAYHSLDLEKCKHGYFQRVETAIPCIPDYKRSREIFSLGFSQALNELGLQSGQFEFSSLLDLFVNQPDQIKRWLSGEAVIPYQAERSSP